jgi:hypothetical protein
MPASPPSPRSVVWTKLNRCDSNAGAGALLARSRQLRRGRSVSPDSARPAASLMVPFPGLTQMVSPWWRPWWPSWPLLAHDAGALPSIVSVAGPAILLCLELMLLPPLLPFPLAK